MSKFSSYEVLFAGDYASVRMHFAKPVVTRSEKPKGKYDRESFEVVTTSQTFNQQSLMTAISDALKQNDESTHKMLLNAQSSLNDFISKNGATNPNEAADWVVHENNIVQEHALEIA